MVNKTKPVIAGKLGCMEQTQCEKIIRQVLKQKQEYRYTQQFRYTILLFLSMENVKNKVNKVHIDKLSFSLQWTLPGCPALQTATSCHCVKPAGAACAVPLIIFSTAERRGGSQCLSPIQLPHKGERAGLVDCAVHY